MNNPQYIVITPAAVIRQRQLAARRRWLAAALAQLKRLEARLTTLEQAQERDHRYRAQLARAAQYAARRYNHLTGMVPGKKQKHTNRR